MNLPEKITKEDLVGLEPETELADKEQQRIIGIIEKMRDEWKKEDDKLMKQYQRRLNSSDYYKLQAADEILAALKGDGK
jgi:hypothetical protein